MIQILFANHFTGSLYTISLQAYPCLPSQRVLKCLKAQNKDLSSSQSYLSFLVASSIFITWTNTHMHSGMFSLCSERCLCLPDMAQMTVRPFMLLIYTAHPASEASEISVNGTTTPAATQVRNLRWPICPNILPVSLCHHLLKLSMLILHHHHPSTNYVFVVYIFKSLEYHNSHQSGLPLSILTTPLCHTHTV